MIKTYFYVQSIAFSANLLFLYNKTIEYFETDYDSRHSKIIRHYSFNSIEGIEQPSQNKQSNKAESY